MYSLPRMTIQYYSASHSTFCWNNHFFWVLYMLISKASSSLTWFALAGCTDYWKTNNFCNRSFGVNLLNAQTCIQKLSFHFSFLCYLWNFIWILPKTNYFPIIQITLFCLDCASIAWCKFICRHCGSVRISEKNKKQKKDKRKEKDWTPSPSF